MKKIWFEQTQVRQLSLLAVRLGCAEFGKTTSGRARFVVSSVYGILIAGICLSLSLMELNLWVKDSIMKVRPDEVQVNLYIYIPEISLQRGVSACQTPSPAYPRGPVENEKIQGEVHEDRPGQVLKVSGVCGTPWPPLTRTGANCQSPTQPGRSDEYSSGT